MPVIEMHFSMIMHAAAVAMAALVVSTVPVGGLDESERLMVLCLAGGIGGGMMAVLLFPRQTVKMNAAKWLGSSMAAALFGPAGCVWLGVQTDIHYILALAGGIGLVAWGFLFLALPVFQKLAVKALSFVVKDKLHLPEEDDAKP